MSSTDCFLPNGVNLEDLLEGLRSLSWGAADILMAYARGSKPPYGFPMELEIEDNPGGPVSAADLAVNSWLLDGINSKFPTATWKLLSEENAKEEFVEGLSACNGWIWILDPLDGTKDFIKGTGEYAVHLALVNDHHLKMGVVLIPEKEELWFGVLGEGAWCENRLGEKRNVKFSNRTQISEMILVASKSHRDKTLSQLMERISPGETKGIGSVGCKVGTILRGEADFYISLSGKTAPKDWDMAAPEAVLRAAGGGFTHADGRPLSYNKDNYEQRGCLIVSHGKNHDLICKLAEDEIKKLDPFFEI
ncbi:3'(2'),5'-bisphosphate nucleotidase CysQ family protein [Prochlorococcus marinus]|nr:3'(2'),5'-bisphosphate nucleotidase CysQ [Prochlorococcus marinus]